MRVDTMVVLKEYDVLSEAEMAKALLDEVGMWSMVNNEYMSTSKSASVPNVQLITRKCDAARALEIITVKECQCEQDEEQDEEQEYVDIIY